MNKTLLLVSSVIALSSVSAFAANNQKPKTSYLFTQSAKQVVIKHCTSKKECDYQITLKGINPKTTYFSDRPSRLSGHIPTSTFAKNWAKGRDSFKAVNPNASLVYFDAGKIMQSIVELSKPRFNKANNTLAYNVKYLDQGRVIPGTYQHAVVFLDSWSHPTYCVAGNNDSPCVTL